LRIALMSGTGSFGMGLAARWADHHEILLGSRSYDRARDACERVRSMLGGSSGMKIDPMENYHAIKGSEAVVICIEYEHALPAVRDLLGGFKNQIVISPLSPMGGSPGGLGYVRPREGSAAEQLSALLPEGAEVVSCFQGVPASKLLDLGRSLNFDVPIFTDSGSARKKVFDLVRDIKFLRPLCGGPLSLAYLGEMIGPLWRNIASLNKMRDPSLKFIE